MTRSRAYRKNDQAWVEQKNGAIARRLVGYGRFEGIPAGQALARLYAAARLHTNLFQPSFKLKERTRVGARVIKRYHPPAPPMSRVLAHPAVTEEIKLQLRQLHAQAADPVILLAEIRGAQAELGERRPTQRRPYHRRKPVPRRSSMLDDMQDQIRAWLEREATISAAAILKRLCTCPGGSRSQQ